VRTIEPGSSSGTGPVSCETCASTLALAGEMLGGQQCRGRSEGRGVRVGRGVAHPQLETGRSEDPHQRGTRRPGGSKRDGEADRQQVVTPT
jgi:hypothetical protein